MSKGGYIAVIYTMSITNLTTSDNNNKLYTIVYNIHNNRGCRTFQIEVIGENFITSAEPLY